MHPLLNNNKNKKFWPQIWKAVNVNGYIITHTVHIYIYIYISHYPQVGRLDSSPCSVVRLLWLTDKCSWFRTKEKEKKQEWGSLIAKYKIVTQLCNWQSPVSVGRTVPLEDSRALFCWASAIASWSWTWHAQENTPPAFNRRDKAYSLKSDHHEAVS